MATMTPIIKIWYDKLAEGKLEGLQCQKCGKMHFPPVPVCNDCGSFDMEWAPISGEGEIESLTFTPMGVYPFSEDELISGYGKLKEGNLFNSVILNPPEGGVDELRERLRKGPVKFKLKITPLDDVINFPYMEIE